MELRMLTLMGIGAATPRMTFTGPIGQERIAITQSFEYRFVQTPVNSVPSQGRDTKLESFDSHTQLHFILSAKQTATASVAVSPQKLDFLGLNTLTTQQSTPDFHQRGYQVYLQDLLGHCQCGPAEFAIQLQALRHRHSR